VAIERDDTDERVVGMVGVAAAGPDVPAPVLRGRSGVARLERPRVAPERRRQGIGRRLTEAAIAWAREHGFGTLLPETTPQQTAAIGLYRRLGFAEVGRSRLGAFELVWFELPVAASRRGRG
jgi:ribosomal protein S18 acetylase RimI-like enzyme